MRTKDVRFKNQGLDLIEVQDNGSGISPSNYEYIALKHHTSKLHSYDDIGTLETFGFRGEALASLCALSTMTVTTCLAQEAPKGSKLAFDPSGKLRDTTVVAAQRGTIVAVERLFHTLPVRRRELERNIKREWQKVIALLNQYACIQTNLKFSVSQQPTKGRRIALFSTKGNITTRDNIINIFGAKTLAGLIPLDLELELQPTALGSAMQIGVDSTTVSTKVRIVGHVSRPNHGEGRLTPDRQMFFVNARPCGLPQFAKVFNEVYKSYNASQSPFILADIQLDTHMYDVNVSPDKRTILLHEQSHLLENVRSSLTRLFDDQDHVVPASQLLRTPNLAVQTKNSIIPSTQPRLKHDSPPCALSTAHGSALPGLTASDEDTGRHVTQASSRASPNSSSSPANHGKAARTFDHWLAAAGPDSATQLSSKSALDVDSESSPSSPEPALEQTHGLDGASTEEDERLDANYTQSNRRAQATSKSTLEAATSDDTRPTKRPRIAGNSDGDICYKSSLSNESSCSDTSHPSSIEDESGVSDRNVESAAASPETRLEIQDGAGSQTQHFGVSQATNCEPSFSSTSNSAPRLPDVPDENRAGMLLLGKDRGHSHETKTQHSTRAGALQANSRRKGNTSHLVHHLVLPSEVLCGQIQSWRRFASPSTSHAHYSRQVEDITAADAESRLPLIIAKSDFAKMRVAGQFNLGFIIAVRPSTISDSSDTAQCDELFIIDQHASDEKYNFERLQDMTMVQSQRLVVPKQLTLTALEEEIVMQGVEAIEANGFKIGIDLHGESAVGSRCQLLALPLSRETTFNLTDLEELIALMGDESSQSRTIPRPSKVRKMFAMRACRSSIMIGRPLTPRQMYSLVNHMGELDKPWNCPHGRPTMRHLCRLDNWDSAGWTADLGNVPLAAWGTYQHG